MNLEYYKNFVAIVDSGTFSRASEKLLVAQPALSKQVQMLEEKYGAQLLIRKPRKLILTDAGKILYDKIQSICYLEDSAQKEIEAITLGNRGTLWIGYTPNGPEHLVKTLLMEFHARHPQVDFEIFEQNSDKLLELLNSGMIEIALLRSLHTIPGEIQTESTLPEYITAYFHKEHPGKLENGETVDIRELEKWPISISKGLQSGFSLACEQAGFRPRYQAVCESRSSSMFWAADKETVSIIVAPHAYDMGDYCCRKINVKGLGRSLSSVRAIATKKGRFVSAVGRRFLDFARQHPLTRDWTGHGEVQNAEK